VESTEKGYLYIISNPAYKGWCKVGITEDINKRLSTYQTGDPFRSYKVEYILHHFDYKTAEKRLKETMKPFAKQIKGEWYEIDLMMARDRLDEQLGDYNNSTS
jgi:predicted GIY-YIG superfamily endonuclease